MNGLANERFPPGLDQAIPTDNYVGLFSIYRPRTMCAGSNRLRIIKLDDNELRQSPLKLKKLARNLL
jgi:hypothetical protein